MSSSNFTWNYKMSKITFSLLTIWTVVSLFGRRQKKLSLFFQLCRPIILTMCVFSPVTMKVIRPAQKPDQRCWGGSLQIMRHEYAAPGAYFYQAVRASVYPPLSLRCLCAPVCRTSQQEQPKSVPLMSSCGRPPAKSQRLSLLLPQCHLSSPHFLPPLFLCCFLLLLRPYLPSLSVFVIFHHLCVLANLHPLAALRLNSSSLTWVLRWRLPSCW